MLLVFKISDDYGGSLGKASGMHLICPCIPANLPEESPSAQKNWRPKYGRHCRIDGDPGPGSVEEEGDLANQVVGRVP